MLVFTRKLGTKIFIEVDGLESPIVVQLTKIDRGQCRIGIVADEEVRIYRDDIYPAVLQGRIDNLKQPPSKETSHAEDSRSETRLEAPSGEHST